MSDKDIRMEQNLYLNQSEKEQNDVETISANTEDSLLNTRSNSESNSISKGSSEDSCYTKKKSNCCSNCGLATGIILTTIGIAMLIWTPFDVFMTERLKMMPGLPPFEWWRTPPDEVLLRVYLFNVTNAESFLNGSDNTIKMEEVGPIIYLEKLVHKNVTFNANGTLSYMANRSAIFLPEYNSIDLNATLILPNYAVLGMASYLYDASFFTKFGFNMLLRGVKSPPFLKTTIYNTMWNLSDPILSVAKQFAPEQVPSENIGILDTIYRDFEDLATVYIGTKNGHEKFFLLDKYHGSEYLLGHGPSCPELIVNSTEGALYPQYITKNTTLRYWRKTLCKVIPLYYEEDRYMDEYNVLAYKFTKPSDAYNRKLDLNTDCHKGSPILPDGLSDVSKCYNGIPMAASFPHFLYGSDKLHTYVSGLRPNRSEHESFIIVEPLTGIPIQSTARSQSNLVVRDLSGFSTDLQKFSHLVLPMFWLEYNQVGLPYYVKWLMNFTVVILPNCQYYFIGLTLALGIVILVVLLRKIINSNKTSNYKQNTNLHFEQETFIKLKD